MLKYIPKYFPEFSKETLEKLEIAMNLHKEWNTRINVISRKDIENIESHHYLHSLSLIKFMEFENGIEILDVGTGGGFPGIPLAIVLPQVKFFLLDSIQKKLKVIREIKLALDLKNVQDIWSRIEDYKDKHDILTARAVTSLPKFYDLVKKNAKNKIIYIKGGNFVQELQSISLPYELYKISEKINEPFFETKKIVSLQIV